MIGLSRQFLSTAISSDVISRGVYSWCTNSFRYVFLAAITFSSLFVLFLDAGMFSCNRQEWNIFKLYEGRFRRAD